MDSNKTDLCGNEKERGITLQSSGGDDILVCDNHFNKIIITEGLGDLTAHQLADLRKLAIILGNREPITQVQIDHLSMIVPQESPKKVDGRFWAQNQANKQLRNFR